MLCRLLKFFAEHEWKSFCRGSFHHKSTVEKILLFLTFFFIWLQVVIIILCFPFMIQQHDSGPLIPKLKYMYLVFSVTDFLIRIVFMQNRFSFYPYLCLPAGKRTVTLYVVIRQILSCYNLIYILTVLPLLIKSMILYPSAVPLILFLTLFHPVLFCQITFLFKNTTYGIQISYFIIFLLLVIAIIDSYRRILIMISGKLIFFILNDYVKTYLSFSVLIALIVILNVHCIKRNLFIESRRIKPSKKLYPNGIFT